MREGTTKSLAPSGVDLMSTGVSTSMINDLQNLIDDNKNTSELAELLKIPPSSAGAIKGLSTQTIDSLSYMNKRDTTASAFKIYLTVKDAGAIPIIQEGLKKFFSYFFKNTLKIFSVIRYTCQIKILAEKNCPGCYRQVRKFKKST